MVLEKTLESSLDCKEIQPVRPKGNQSWIFIGRTDAEAETPILWPPHVKSWLTGKDPDAGKDWRQEEEGTTVWDGCMASPIQWTWVWVNSGDWWWTGKPGVLRSTGSQRVGHGWATELNWTELVRQYTLLDVDVHRFLGTSYCCSAHCRLTVLSFFQSHLPSSCFSTCQTHSCLRDFALAVSLMQGNALFPYLLEAFFWKSQ